MTFLTLRFTIAGLALFVGLLFCHPINSAHGNSSVAALRRHLLEVGFNVKHAHFLVESAVSSNTVSLWLRNGGASYSWLARYIPRDTHQMILANPWLLGMSVDRGLEPRMETLVGLGLYNILDLCGRFPGLLDPRISDQQIKDMFNLLKTEDVNDINQVVTAHPPILVEKDPLLAAATVLWLKQKLGLKKVGPVVESIPDIFSYSISFDLNPVFEALSIGWAFQTNYIVTHPQLLRASVIELNQLRTTLLDLRLDLQTELTPDERRLLILHSSPYLIFNNLLRLGYLPDDAESTKDVLVQPSWLSRNLQIWGFDPLTCKTLFGS